jgi:hypothetical protein
MSALARTHVMGLSAVVVVDAADGIEARDLQRSGRDRHDEAVLSRPVQAHSLPYPGFWVLLMARYTGRAQPWYFTARDGSPAPTIVDLWDEWHDKTSGEMLKSCTMIITEPNKFVVEAHGDP